MVLTSTGTGAVMPPRWATGVVGPPTVTDDGRFGCIL